jgi:hypothetical protein
MSEGGAIYYDDPSEFLKKILDGRTLQTNAAGHTVLDDFEHFCSYTGCDPGNAWAKLCIRECSVTNP